jgi:hypothetical protein
MNALAGFKPKAAKNSRLSKQAIELIKSVKKDEPKTSYNMLNLNIDSKAGLSNKNSDALNFKNILKDEPKEKDKYGLCNESDDDDNSEDEFQNQAKTYLKKNVNSIFDNNQVISIQNPSNLIFRKVNKLQINLYQEK